MYTFEFNGETINLYRAVSVRTFNVTRRAGYPISTADECLTAAMACVNDRIRNGGIRTATELMRAGGMGIYQIWKVLDAEWCARDRRENLRHPFPYVTLSRVRMECERLDTELHGRIN